MEPMFTSQHGDSYFHEEVLDDYSSWPVDPWYNHAQPCSPAFPHPLKVESAPYAAQDAKLIPWMNMSNPETPPFSSPTTEQPPTHLSAPVPGRPRQAPPMRAKHSQVVKKKKKKKVNKTNPVVKDELLDKPIMKRLHSRRPKSSSSNDNSSSAEDYPTKEKDDRFQERSRMASNKFRARKRCEIAKLESEEYSIEDANRTLRGVLDALTSEILCLKMQILQHTNCNCELIQEYISKEALNFVLNLETVSS
ncbi:hypothetical protein E4U43_002403 [Claviceps pusilla]|uniref:BZIP domain-containing protein n=1 Tax=Claviceps pusilla TaxID=123648 RepID=A0A9P7N6N9_9HYPO|nr:hypothetical protein E4U43_002403 [Claviceps pusilla]